MQIQKSKLIQVIFLIIFLFALDWTASRSDLIATSFQQEIKQVEAEGKMPIVMLCQNTGTYSYVGKSAVWSADYAVKELNRNGGVNGKNVELVVKDTHSEKALAASYFLGASKEALVIIGPVDAPESAEISKYLRNSKVVNLAAYSYNEIRQAAAPYAVSYMSDSEKGELAAIENWKSENPSIKRVVIFTGSEEDAQKQTTNLFQSELPKIGIQIVDVVNVATNGSDLDYKKYAIQALNKKSRWIYIHS